MPETSVEALAIVKATLAEVDAHHSAIMLSMWHHLIGHPQRDVLLANFGVGGNAQAFLPALLAAVKMRLQGGWPELRVPAGMSREAFPLLQHAFAAALRDVLGDLAAPMVVNAWSELVRSFLRELLHHGTTS